ncbi:MAG: sodium ion-translocating decarboxylase subunit beta [Paludibacteraceae bacterium]|jgi:oxaloacetate decarboxylase beta subunit|nr:sodium ion-translocating decarboxylase subunit beta [Paludibacteraceae bacterium]MBR2260921.1 sodium ion-translocating decarboxylase subunit beta [Paludibacteraceae bacterium]MEE3482963.1 sodium ion-translocating decarboxylase subunit beta [Bacteroidales bacterium]
MVEILEKIYGMTAIGELIANPSYIVMILLAFFLLYLGIKKEYEPLLLIPIAFGVLIANFPGGGMGVIATDGEGMVHFIKNGQEVAKNIYEMSLPEIAHDLGIMNFLYYALIKSGLLPPIIFMGVGALTDFGPMLRNLKLAIFGAGAQFGIFAVLIVASQCGFDMKEAGSLAIIGGADGPTAIFTTLKLAPDMLGPIAIAAYSYMALVPVIVPLVVKLTCSEKELKINMKEQDKLYPNKQEFKNMRVLKIIFPIAVTVIVGIIVRDAVALVGMLMFGNLIKEIGSNTSRLFNAASNGIMNAATIFLGLCVGATMTVDAFLNIRTIGIVAGGFCAFGFSIFGGILLVKIMNLFSKKKINPLVGATGLSAVPMASRVANDIALKYDSRNHVLNYCMSSNVAGVIGSAVAAGILIKFLG